MFFILPNVLWSQGLELNKETIDSLNWNGFDLTGGKAKLIEKKKPIPLWIPVTGGVITAGGITTAVLLNKKEPEHELPVANSDNIQIECGSETTINLTQNDTGEDIYISDVSTPSAIEITIVNKGSVFIPDVGNESFQFSYTITDKYGKTSSASVSVSITDTQAPEITCPDDKTINCDDPKKPDFTGFATAYDNCTNDDQLSYTYDDDYSGLTDCNKTGSYKRMWTVKDAAGNSAECTQTIKVVDNTLPTIKCPPETIVLAGESRDPDITGFPEVDDNCTNQDELIINYTDDESGIEYYSGKVIRNWYVRDACNNENKCEQTIIVQQKDCEIDISFETNNPDCGLSNGTIATVYDNTISPKFYWSNGSNEPTINNLRSGKYQLTVTIEEQSCESIYNVELSQNPIDYIKKEEIAKAVCPQGGNIVLELDSPGEGNLYLSVFNDGTEKEFYNIQKGKLELKDLMFIDSGAYLITIYDVSLGDTCSQDYETYVPAAEPYKLEIVQLNNPTNADQNNGSAVFTFDLSTVKIPLDIYLNNEYYGQAWEPGFIVENLSAGTHSVYVVDANGCKSKVTLFTLYGDFQSSIPSISICNDFEKQYLYQNILQNWLIQELSNKNINEFPPGEDKKLRFFPGYYNSSNVINLNYANPVNNNYSTGLGINIGQISSILSIFIPEKNETVILPVFANGTSINLDFSRNFFWKNYYFSIRGIAGYNQINIDPKSFISINVDEIKDLLKTHLTTINIELGISKRLLKGSSFYFVTGIGNTKPILDIENYKPYIHAGIKSRFIYE